MASDELKQLLALRWAGDHDPTLPIEVLRGPYPDPGCTPRDGAAWEVCDANGVYCEWVSFKEPSKNNVFVYLHGGGYYRASAQASRMAASNISKVCDCRVLTVDYRLAPENKFPAALEDAYSSYHWLLERGISSKDIIVGGSSAGGGLTAALLIKLKMEDDPLPAAAVLLSPWTDLTQSADTYRSNADKDPSISKQYLDVAAQRYLGDTDPKEPLVSPVYAQLEGLPPLLIQVGKDETMLGDAEAFAEKAVKAGIEVRFEVYEDVPHAWHNSEQHIPGIPEVWEALGNIAEFCAAHSC